MGKVDALTLSLFSCPEEYLKMAFGGGRYLLYEERGDKLIGPVAVYQVAGRPIIKGRWAESFPVGRPAVPSPQEAKLSREVERLERELREQRWRREIDGIRRRIETLSERAKGIEVERRRGADLDLDLAVKLIELIQEERRRSFQLRLLGEVIKGFMEGQAALLDAACRLHAEMERRRRLSENAMREAIAKIVSIGV